MAFIASTIRNCTLLVAATFVLGALSTSAHAYTQEQEQMCTGDAMRLCSSEIPDVDRVTACMIRNRSQLSDGCKAVFRPEPTATPANYAPGKASKPMNINPHKRG